MSAHPHFWNPNFPQNWWVVECDKKSAEAEEMVIHQKVWQDVKLKSSPHHFPKTLSPPICSPSIMFWLPCYYAILSTWHKHYSSLEHKRFKITHPHLGTLDCDSSLSSLGASEKSREGERIHFNRYQCTMLFNCKQCGITIEIESTEFFKLL